ncbi:uncharacterized mitochondrial protein AtMg00860-like [Aquila chrysaetos chrysaetos]|uniref:uncharacterized mitochondrial protein AtMg00860-like n=1 Tax=Aquila chrysaetos chrysaetos TaxID=223781 RepID=UPI001B7D4368|nr:uncharacterized mitochondrial protein AtMg00860-like [Aquila chrysaetos chrysaetos]XP_040977477.1 uncharacterized mitochondrial protein AtMg00860-like [Aquila chrysaetos chrysaetos]
MSGYRVSREKARIAQETVMYLGFEIFKGHRQLSTERKEAICHLPEPDTLRELRTFLGMTRWCRLWIDEYGLMVRPLYEMLKASTDTCLEWTEEGRSAFRNLKQALLKAPTLALPNLEKPFELFVREK